MKSPHILAALIALGLAGCEAKVTTAPSPSSTTTKIEVKPAEAPTAPPASGTTETTKQTTVTTPSGRTATKTETTTETKKP